MYFEKAFVVGITRKTHYAGTPGRIRGVTFMVLEIPGGPAPVALLNYVVRYPDGTEGHVDVNDTANYAIVSESDVVSGRVPPVTVEPELCLKAS